MRSAAYTQSITGTIEGSILDPSRLTVSGAEVRFIQVQTEVWRRQWWGRSAVSVPLLGRQTRSCLNVFWNVTERKELLQASLVFENVVARDGIAQHYTALTIPLAGIYLDPALGLKCGSKEISAI